MTSVEADRTIVYRPEHIRTMDAALPAAEAFAVRGDRVIAVGDLDDVRAAAGVDAPVERLDGVVLPGLIDAHMHMQRAGLKALDYVDPDDGVERYIDAMRDSFHDDGPVDPPLENRVAALVRVQPLLHALGMTSVVDPAVSVDEMRGYQEAKRRGLLTMRTVAMPWHDLGSARTPDVDAVIAHLEGIGVSTGFGDDRLRIGAIKVYADGEALKGQALLDVPWDEHGYHGLQRLGDDDYLRLVAWCAQHGWGVGTHAVGSGAIALVARAAAAAGASHDLRSQAIHAYLEPSDASIRSAADSGVIASLQPSIIWHNGAGLRRALGDRAERANPVRSWLDAGATVAFGSDGPFFAFDPRMLMWQAVTRRVADEREPLSLEEAVTVEEALAAYTTGAAYAAYAEHDRGRLRAGDYADWTLWADDPVRVDIDALCAVEIRRTVVGGRTVFRKDA